VDFRAYELVNIYEDENAYWKPGPFGVLILERDWKTLGAKLAGKIRIKVGTLDTFYLEKAVRHLEAFLERTTEPYWRGSIEYGHDHPHCYTGDPSVPVAISSRTVNQRLLPEMAEHMLRTAPPGADVSSWRY